MLRRFRADLHVHTCLSPCGDLQMSPQKIIAQSQRQGVQILAICDHNSAENIPAVLKAAASSGIVVLPGLEICTSEEVHILSIFDNVRSATEMQELVYGCLHGINQPEVFGLQVVANELDEVVGFQDKLLIGATDLTVGQVVVETHRLGGLAIASHIDRESYSVMSQLGFIPEDVKFDALELTRFTTDQEARIRFALPPSCVFVRNSDAHVLEDIGSNTSEYLLERPAFEEIQMALNHEASRMVCLV